MTKDILETDPYPKELKVCRGTGKMTHHRLAKWLKLESTSLASGRAPDFKLQCYQKRERERGEGKYLSGRWIPIIKGVSGRTHPFFKGMPSTHVIMSQSLINRQTFTISESN
jgi:hypothetical protein